MARSTSVTVRRHKPPGSTSSNARKRGAADASSPWRTGARRELVQAALAGLSALTVAMVVLRGWRNPLSVPLNATGDALPALMVVRNMQVSGWFQTTDALNYPFGQNLAGYPGYVGDTWNLLILKLLSLIVNPAAAVNLFFLMGFPLAAVVAYLCARRLGLRSAAAVFVGVLFAVMPYHFLRGEAHLFLSAYYAVPVTCLLTVRLYQGTLTLPSLRRGERRRRLLVLAAVLLVAGTGSYYALFSLVLFAAAGALGSLSRRDRQPLIAAATASAIVVGVLALAAIPNVLHESDGRPPAGRDYGASETLGLRLTSLLLPVSDHRLAALSSLSARTGDVLHGENYYSALGLLASLGLLLGLAALALPGGRQGSLRERLRPPGVVMLVAIVFGTVGGLSGMLAVLGFGLLRAGNRISIIVAFLALLSIAILVQHALRSATRALVVVGFAGLAVVGALDQTSPAWQPPHEATAAAWGSDRAYFTAVEERFGADAAVFQLPVIPFPEHPPVMALGSYEHLRGYLHSDLRWSHGGLRGPTSDWQAIAVQSGIDSALPQILGAGFDAVYVDRDGYEDGGQAVEARLQELLGDQPPLVDGTGSLATYDLRPLAAGLEADAAPVPSAPVTVAYVNGCSALDVGLATGLPADSAMAYGRWCGAETLIRLHNESDGPRSVQLVGQVETGVPDAQVRLQGGGATLDFGVPMGGRPLAVPLVLPPGATDVRLRTDSAARPSVNDPRDLRLLLVGLRAVDEGLLETTGTDS